MDLWNGVVSFLIGLNIILLRVHSGVENNIISILNLSFKRLFVVWLSVGDVHKLGEVVYATF